MKDVRWPLTWDGPIRRLTEHPHSQTGQKLFPTIRGAMCFAALVGYQTGNKDTVTGETRKLEGKLIFPHPATIETIYAIALADTQDMDIIRPENEDKMISIFEQYVTGGLKELTAWFEESPGDIDGVDALINAATKRGLIGGQAEEEDGPEPEPVF